MKKTIQRIILLTLLLLLWGAEGYGQISCGTVGMQRSIHCAGDTVQMTAVCNTGNCTYNWLPPNPGTCQVIAGQGTQTVTVVLRPNYSGVSTFSHTYSADTMYCHVTDVGQGCAYYSGHAALINHQANLGILPLDGPWDGNPATIQRYAFTYINRPGPTYYYTQQPTWTLLDGNLNSVTTSALFNGPAGQLSPRQTDTVRVNWTGASPVLRLNLRTEGNAMGRSLTNHACYLNDSLVVQIGGEISGGLPICGQDTLTYTFPSAPGATYTWTAVNGNILSGQGTSTVEVEWMPTSGYLICERVWGSHISVDTTWLQVGGAQVNLGPNQVLCAGGSVTLTASPSPDSVIWSTGATTGSITVSQAGTYSVAAYYNGCISWDTVIVSGNGVQIDLGPDRVACSSSGAQVLSGQGGFSSYVWSTGATTSSISVNASGSYSVTATNSSGCPSSDVILVTIHPSPQPNLGPNQAMCASGSLVLSPGMGPGSFTYTWSNGSTAPQLMVTQVGNYSVTVTDQSSGCTGSDAIQIGLSSPAPLFIGNDTSICEFTSASFYTSTTGISYAWSTGQTSPNITVNQPGTYSLTVTTAGGCVLSDTAEVTFAQGCVFPGDADYDGVADNNDVLALGIAFANTGPVRSWASNSWYGQKATDWSTSLPSSVNCKHTDCDGDGVVTDNDTLPIFVNYGSTHAKSSGTTGGIPVSIVALFDSVQAGDMATFSVVIGDAQNLVDSVYGIAFTVNYDTATVDTEGLFFCDYSTCWFTGGSPLTFTYDLYPDPMADLAITRTNGTDTTGWGEVCRVGFVTIDNISGKRQTMGRPLHVWLSDVRLISASMTVTATALYGDSVVVYEEGLLAPGSDRRETVRMVPVPADKYLQVNVENGMLERVRVMDLSGKVLATAAAELGEVVRVETEALPAGVYMVEIKSTLTTYMKKVVIQH